MTTTKINLESFMQDVSDATNLHYKTFQTILRHVNTNYFGGTLYTQIKDGQVSVEQLAHIMKGQM